MTQCQPLLHVLALVVAGAWLPADTAALGLVARGNATASVAAGGGDTGVFRSSTVPSGGACGSVPLACAPNCAAAIRDALTKCSAAGGGTVVLAAGLYHLNDSAVEQLQPMIALSGLANVALVGQPGAGRYDSLAPDPTATTLLVYGMRGGRSRSPTPKTLPSRASMSTWHGSPTRMASALRWATAPLRSTSTRRCTHSHRLSRITYSRSSLSWASTRQLGVLAQTPLYCVHS